MMKESLCLSILIMISIIVLGSCRETAKTEGFAVESEKVEKSTYSILRFSLKLNQESYVDSFWGEPPQIAIWLETPEGDEIRTVWVTRRTGQGDWAGKLECPVALPFWVSRYNKETHTEGAPTPKEPAPAAVTGATPKLELRAQVKVPSSSLWNYYIEVNVSGDFNDAFPSMTPAEVLDPHGNGQPSLIYKGQIKAEPGSSSMPTLIGRTDQLEPIDHMITDLSDITTAKELFLRMEVACNNF